MSFSTDTEHRHSRTEMPWVNEVEKREFQDQNLSLKIRIIDFTFNREPSHEITAAPVGG